MRPGPQPPVPCRFPSPPLLLYPHLRARRYLQPPLRSRSGAAFSPPGLRPLLPVPGLRARVTTILTPAAFMADFCRLHLPAAPAPLHVTRPSPGLPARERPRTTSPSKLRQPSGALPRPEVQVALPAAAWCAVSWVLPGTARRTWRAGPRGEWWWLASEPLAPARPAGWPAPTEAAGYACPARPAPR